MGLHQPGGQISPMSWQAFERWRKGLHNAWRRRRRSKNTTHCGNVHLDYKLEELSQEALMVSEQGLPQVQDEGDTGGARGSDDVHPVNDVAKGKQAELDDDFASRIGPLMLPSRERPQWRMQISI